MRILLSCKNRTNVALKRIFSRRNYQKHLTPIFINRSTVFSFFGNYFQLDAQQLSVCPDSEKSFWDENYQKHLTPIFINCSTVFSFFGKYFQLDAQQLSVCPDSEDFLQQIITWHIRITSRYALRGSGAGSGPMHWILNCSHSTSPRENICRKNICWTLEWTSVAVLE